jgi:hypothetical protein
MKISRQHIRSFVFLAGFLAISFAAACQNTPVAKNVKIHIENNQAIIRFDIVDRGKQGPHVVDLQFLDEDYNMISPKLTSGDVGPGISAGSGKTIVWEITNDMDLLGSEISPVLFIDGKSKQFNRTGGPRNAFLSLLMPGLGDYAVADPSLMTFKPYMRTLSSWGMMGLGFYLGSQREHAPGEYRTVLKADHFLFTGEARYEERYFPGPMQYGLFQGDMEVFVSLGAAIWAADIIWVLARGSNNRKFTRALSQGTSFQLGYVPGGAGFHFTKELGWK